MNISEIDFGKLVLRPPRKYDESFICKIEYGSEKKFLLTFPHSMIISHNKDSNTLTFKPDSVKLISKTLVKIEDQLMKLAISNASDWFTDKIKTSRFESHFHSCAIIHPEQGHAIKLRYIGETEHSIDVKSVYDITVQLHGIRFTKNSFTLLCKLTRLQAISSTAQFIEAPESDFDDDLEIDIDVDEEIKEEINSKLEYKLEQIEADIERLTVTRQALQNLKDDLDTATTLASVLRVGDALEQVE